MAGAGGRERRDQPEETGQPQVGDHDHHAKEKCDRSQVDRGEGVLKADGADRHHETGAEQRRAGPVDAVAGDAADGDDGVGGEEDEDRDNHGRTVCGYRWIGLNQAAKAASRTDSDSVGCAWHTRARSSAAPPNSISTETSWISSPT